MGPDTLLRVAVRPQSARKKPFPRSFAKLGTIYLVKFIIFMTARLPIQNLESFRAQTEKLKFEQSRGPGFEPTRGRQFFFNFWPFLQLFIFLEVISNIVTTFESVMAGYTGQKRAISAFIGSLST